MGANERTRLPLRLKAALATAGAVLSLQAGAHDLGVQGKIWDITEIDMRMLVMQSALRANFGDVGAQMKESAKQYLENMPKRTLAVPEKTETRWVDPSIELNGDIQTVTTDEATQNFKWSMLFQKGTRVNPLLARKPVTALFFFDGKSEEQVEFAKNILREDEHGRVVLLEATGTNIQNLTKAMGRPVFSANDAQVRRFNITQAPTLVFAGNGTQNGLLGLTGFAPPYKVADLTSVWALSLTKPNGPKQGAQNDTKKP